MMRSGDLQELRIWMRDWAFCDLAPRYTCMSVDAGPWAACCMLHAAELRSAALTTGPSTVNRGDLVHGGESMSTNELPATPQTHGDV